MRIGVPSEVKAEEHRVAMTPAGVRELTDRGHQVVVQAGAGVGSAFVDDAYAAQGAEIAPDAAAVFAAADTIVKVKEPRPQEVAMLEARHVLFTYLHLAPDAALTQGLIDSGATCIAYETITDAAARLPLLAPMSEVAGRLATQAGAYMLGRPAGGSGVLLGGVPGVAAGKVLVIGGGIVGANAARTAVGLGADVTVLDRSIDRLRELDQIFGGTIQTGYSTGLEVEARLAEADLVIGAVLVRGARAPHLVSRAQLALMKPRSVMVDVAIDQGGCFETSHPTTHADPVYEIDGISHYCVANMPGAVPVTATRALTNATLPYVVRLADGVEDALRSDPGFLGGLSVRAGRLTDAAVARDQGREWTAPEEALAATSAMRQDHSYV
jgi:alanine dehydrogenase